MSIVQPAARVRPGFAAVNPVAKLAALVPLAMVLLLTLDPVLNLTVLALSMLALLCVRAPLGGSVAAVVWISAPLAGVTMALYGRGGGEVYFRFGPAEISQGSLLIACATMSRVLALAVPSLALFRTIDLTAFADAAAQTLHLPNRFVIGGFAGLRQLELALDDWRQLRLARRSRGLADRARIAGALADASALMVLLVRRGGVLAMVMEARGFAAGPRTWNRPAPWGRAERLVVVVGVTIAVIAAVAAISVGSWRFAWT